MMPNSEGRQKQPQGGSLINKLGRRTFGILNYQLLHPSDLIFHPHPLFCCSCSTPRLVVSEGSHQAQPLCTVNLTFWGASLCCEGRGEAPARCSTWERRPGGAQWNHTLWSADLYCWVHASPSPFLFASPPLSGRVQAAQDQKTGALCEGHSGSSRQN